MIDETTLSRIKFRTVPYDGAKSLTTKKQVICYLDLALEDGDPHVVALALGEIARSKGMIQIAEETGLSRESLYTSLSEDGNPRLSTFLKVLHAMGITLRAKGIPVRLRAAVLEDEGRLGG